MKTLKATEEDLPDKFELVLNDVTYFVVMRYMDQPYIEVFNSSMSILGASKIPEGSWYTIREDGLDSIYAVCYSSNKNDIRMVFTYAENQ